MAQVTASIVTAMRQATTAVDPPAESTLRRRRPDQLEYLADGLRSQTCHDRVLDIVTHIFWINAIVLKALRDRFYGFPKIIPRLDDDFKPLITKEEVNVASDIGNLYEPRIKGRITTHLRTLTPDERRSFILDDNPCQFYREALKVKVIREAASRRAMATAEKDPHLPRPEFYDSCITVQDYIGQLGVEMEENHYQLVAFLKIFKELLNSVREAARLALLLPEELDALRIKFQAVADYYESAYSAAHGTTGPEQQLLNADSENWWETNTGKKSKTPSPEGNVFTAYQSSQTMRSSLNVIVPVMLLLSVLLYALAWKYGTTGKATFTDSNFYQTISGNVLQLSSPIMFVYQTLGDPRLSRLNWVWIWILAGFSGACTLTSPLLYWFVSSTWSSGFSTCGAILLVILHLQVANSV